MQVSTYHVSSHHDLEALRVAVSHDADLTLVYASPIFFENDDTRKILLSQTSPIVGCSSAGEIYQDKVYDYSAVVTVLRFEQGGSCRVNATYIDAMPASFEAGKRAVSPLVSEQLKAIFCLAPGLNINGSALIEGMSSTLPPQVSISGGLAGDNAEFKQTYVLCNGEISQRMCVAIGFYGSSLSLDYGAFGGWRSFGPARQVTRSEDNIVYELDGISALDLYKKYLGDYAKDLPASGLLFPFEVLTENLQASGLIRTILGVDTLNDALILAGDVEQGTFLRLMHASTDDLVDGAEIAAQEVVSQLTKSSQHDDPQSIALLTSCIGRKLVMGERVDEETEAVSAFLPPNTQMCGFFSYGEMNPFSANSKTRLHNQTMAITLLRERHT